MEQLPYSTLVPGEVALYQRHGTGKTDKGSVVPLRFKGIPVTIVLGLG